MFGYNVNGELGLGDTTNRNVPTLLTAPNGYAIINIFMGALQSSMITAGLPSVYPTHVSLHIPIPFMPCIHLLYGLLCKGVLSQCVWHGFIAAGL